MTAGSPSARTRVKICGITRPEDGLEAARLGADAIGLAFYAPRPRAVSVGRAAEIAACLPPFVTRVGLFVDALPAEIEAVLAAVPLDLLQFHGDETEAECVRFGYPYLKAVSMRPDRDVVAALRAYPSANGFLLDAYHPAVPGGSGESFDWRRVPTDRPRPIVLAGGLTPDNVADAVRAVRPYAVDVSSGVEAAKGIKDVTKMAEFIRGVQRGDESGA
ncbi:MAG: phosphoribosylanthranilate isomerase [Gammaproteobacteria bacterium]|nr:phosphoribosylanthranilate isomerase [Gammaproteobacteria bacterium]